MKSSELNGLLNGSFSGEDLHRLIKDEVSNYSLLMKKKGSTIPLRFYEDEEIFLKNSNFTKLLLGTLSGGLSNIHLAYICDCLSLGEEVHFENEKLKDLVFGIADPEINGGYKKDSEIKEFIADLTNPKK
jgi:hypothetical protein